MEHRERKQQAGCCTVIRIIRVTPFTMNFNSDEPPKPNGDSYTELGPCNTPLFGDGVICRGCRSGWEVEGNRFASEAEKLRATTLPAPAFKCYRPAKYRGKARNVRSVQHDGTQYLYQLSGITRDIPESELQVAD